MINFYLPQQLRGSECFEYFLVRKGPNLFVSVFVQRPSPGKQNACILYYLPYSFGTFEPEAASGERHLLGLCQASQWWLTNFSQILHVEHGLEIR